jgi:diacylglycerol O-acyltransferase / wax synthase
VLRRPRLVPELGLGLAIFGLYSLVASYDERPRVVARAMRHGHWVFRFERALGLDVELSLNHWLAPHHLLRVAANYEYAITYVVAAFALLAYLYVRRPAEYRWARTSFVLLNLLGIAGFGLFPVAPPRLRPDLGFVDTVSRGHTWGSWGSPLVTHANQMAAVPSLHIAWAVWVSFVLARLSSARWVQLFSAVHVLVTLFVIMGTANHYLVDAVLGALVAGVGVALVDDPAQHRLRVPAADGFFLHVESPADPQHVGGLAVMDTASTTFDRAKLEAVVRAHLAELPRFRQRLSRPSRWRRPHWVDVPADALDWPWHVPLRDLTGPDGRPGGLAALNALVAELQATPLPRDRPLWRFVAVTGVAPDRAAAILIVHHVIADGVGTVAQALTMLEPVPPVIPRQRSAPPPEKTSEPKRLVGTVVGLAQLATDGRPALKLPASHTATRRFGTVTLPLDEVRAVARRGGYRISDVLLATVAGGLRRALADAAPAGPAKLRVAVPLMVRSPDSAAEGNLTAAVMTDLPLGPLAEPERLAQVARASRGLHTGTRALASNFVMRQVGGALPPPVHAWFAHTVYGHRFFQAIVSNMPGPAARLSLAGGPLVQVYPILPLAPGAPLAVGALGWAGELHVGLSVDPALVPDAAALADAIGAVFEELRPTGRAAAPAGERTV